MDISDFIVPIIFVIIVIVQIIKAIASGRKETDEDRPTGWKQRLDEVVSQIQKEMDSDYSETPEPVTVWQDISVDDEAIEAWERKAGLTGPSVPPPLGPQKESARAPARESADDHYEKKRAGKPAPAREKTTTSPMFGPGLNELQKAIVWSEILAPPLALRNDK